MSSPNTRQQGAAIILAILVVAIVSTMAAAIVSQYGQAVAHLSGRHDQAQARWLARGAVDWARNVLEDDIKDPKRGQQDNKLEDWSARVPVFDFEEGKMTGQIKDLSGRFNINSLVSENGEVTTDHVEVFQRLLQHLGVSTSQAQNLTADIIDWLDANDISTARIGAEAAWYRGKRITLPPNAPILDIEELHAVRSMSDELFTLLKDHIVALPPGEQRINLNFATPEVVAAHIPGLSLAAVPAPPANYYTKRDEFLSQIPSNLDIPGELDVKTYYFLATGSASWSEATTRMEVLLLRENGRPHIVWQKIL